MKTAEVIQKRYLTVKEFCEVAGVGETSFRARILHNATFKQHVYKPMNKYLIDAEKGLEVLRDVFRELETQKKH